MKRFTGLAVAAAMVLWVCPLEACHLLLPLGGAAAPSSDAASDGRRDRSGEARDASAPDRRPDSRKDLTPAPRGWTTVAKSSDMGRVLGAKMIYCGGVFLFGGTNEKSEPLLGLWEFGASNTWTKRADSVLARHAPAVVCDEQLGALLIFGGRDASGTPQNDLWQWSPSSSWKQLPSSTGPTARWAAYSAYDSLRHRTVVFGGITGIPPGVTTDDLWELDSQSFTWTQATSSPSPSSFWPPARRSDGEPAAFVADGAAPAPLQNRFVIVGGIKDASEDPPSTNALDDTWAWDGKTWTEVCATCLNPARGHAAVVYDRSNHELLVIGGWNASGELAGTWRWDPAGSVVLDATVPSARDTAAVAYDPAHDLIVLFGGNGTPCIPAGDTGPLRGNCGDTLLFQ